MSTDFVQVVRQQWLDHAAAPQEDPRVQHFPYGLMPLTVPLGFAQLLAHMMPDQIRMAAEYHYDRLTQQEIADKRGISKATVCRALKAFDETCDLFHVPRPNHDDEPDTRHVRNISPDLMRAL